VTNTGVGISGLERPSSTQLVEEESTLSVAGTVTWSVRRMTGLDCNTGRTQMKTTKIAACLAFLSAQILAAHVALAVPSDVNGRVATVRVDGNGKGVIYLTVNAAASCATSGGFGFDSNTKAGEAIAKAAISGKLSGAIVRIVGTGSCTNVYTTTEDINSFYLQN
jgi:hypothetical protein